MKARANQRSSGSSASGRLVHHGAANLGVRFKLEDPLGMNVNPFNYSGVAFRDKTRLKSFFRISQL